MRSICTLVLLVASTLWTFALSAETKIPDAVRDAAAGIDEARIRAHIAELASDEYKGRAPGSEGDVMTRRYIVDQLESWGYEPAGPNGSWEQPFPIVGVTSQMPDLWSFSAGDQTLDLGWWEEYMGGSGKQAAQGSFENAEIVFVGYGIDAPEQEWDDFGGMDLRGKVLLMLNNDPDWDPDLFEGTKRLYYGRWTYKYESAAAQGAVAAIIIHTTPSAGYGWNVVQSGWSGEQFELPAGDEERLDLAAWIKDDAAKRLVAMAGQDYDALVESARSRDFTPVPLGITTSLAWTVELTQKETANVVGRLPGSDPQLAAQHVVYSAHHDHLGVGEPDDTGDTIYNGALDNASGVAQTLAAAEAFASLDPRPRRSILILPVAAEEQGLLGSRWYSMNPTMAPGLLAANINIDGGNIFGATKDVAVIGKGKSDLEALLVEAAAMQDRVVVNEPSPDKGYYYRSDQLNFAKIGVPALYFKSGQNYRGKPEGWGKQREDAWREAIYHQPADELTDEWNFDGMVEDTRLAFYVGWGVATRDELPAWTPGDEFEAKRMEALEAVEAGR